MSAGPRTGVRPVLILGGTTEAVRLAEALAARPDLAITTSLAGRTAGPRLPPGATRTGGFGGAAGLAAWLRAHDVAALIDATHPFAATMKANAAAAADAAGVPMLHLLRAPWRPGPGDDWREVASVGDAAREVMRIGVAPGSRVFVTVGRQELAPFATIAGGALLVRSIEPPPPGLLPADARVIAAAGPFDAAAELALMRDHGVGLLVSKNAGGAATYPKIAAARALGLPVVMVRRPPPPGGATVATVEAAIAWLDARLGGWIGS